MGAVFRARDTQLDRVVALKVPFLSSGDTWARDRFYREARAAAALHHPNICPVFDVGEWQGIPYLTMAYIDGRSLAAALEDGTVFPAVQAAGLVRKVALGMQEAHDRGVVHRDLKPANILLRPNGEPVVTDFGLARRGDDQRTAGLTRPGDVIGTLEYMSPEQLDGDNAAVGPPADVYALGVVLYELLTGRRPFAGSTTSMLVAIMLKPPARPRELRPGLPERLEEICLTAMAKRPDDRYPTMAKFAASLTAYLRPQPGGPPTPRPAAPMTPPPAPAPAKEEDPGWEVVEDPPPRPPSKPRSVVKARPSSRRRKVKPARNWPLVLGGGGLAAACLSLIVAAVIMRSATPRTIIVAPPSAPGTGQGAPGHAAPVPPSLAPGPGPTNSQVPHGKSGRK
jgi:serine/threonine-protein kinase